MNELVQKLRDCGHLSHTHSTRFDYVIDFFFLGHWYESSENLICIHSKSMFTSLHCACRKSMSSNQILISSNRNSFYSVRNRVGLLHFSKKICKIRKGFLYELRKNVILCFLYKKFIVYDSSTYKLNSLFWYSLHIIHKCYEYIQYTIEYNLNYYVLF